MEALNSKAGTRVSQIKVRTSDIIRRKEKIIFKIMGLKFYFTFTIRAEDGFQSGEKERTEPAMAKRTVKVLFVNFNHLFLKK